MIGLLFLAVFVAFIYALIWISEFITRQLPVYGGWEILLRTVMVIGVFPLMLIDEIIGKYQFESLCEKNGIQQKNINSIKGKHLTVKISGPDIISKAIPMYEYTISIIDAKTNHIATEFKDYIARGGWMMRHTFLSLGGTGPMLFDGATCNWSSVIGRLNKNNEISLKP